VDHAVDAADEYSNELLGSLRSQRAFLMTSGQRIVAAADAFEITMGRQRSPERASGPSMTPYLRSANVLDGQLDLSDVKEMDFNQTERQKFTLRHGDVLVSEGSASSNAVGAAAMWRAELTGDVCFQNTLLRFRAVEAVSTPSFAYHWCRWAYESGAFREVSSGTNIRHIGSRRAELMPVHLPQVQLQEGLTGLLDVGEATYEASLGYVAALRSARADLLTALLSGNHEIPSTYDEVMSAGV
jgi:type I restriction enzyme, S subunit